MQIVIDGIDFWDGFKPEKYWSLPKTKNPKIEIPNLVFGGDYIAARKIDGNWAEIIKDMDGEFHLRSRTESVNGGFADKIGWIPHIVDELKNIPNGTVLIGELYLPTHESSKNCTRIMGCLKEKALKRQEDEDWKMHFYMFDCVAFNGHNIMNEGLADRVEYIRDLYLDELIKSSHYVDEALYYEGQELWDYIGEVLAAGGEGVVLQKRNSPYTPGKRTAWKTCKVKKEIGNELDLFFTGRYKPSTREYKSMKGIREWQYWEHTRTGEKMLGYYYDDYKAGATIEPISKGYYYGWAGSIELGAVDGDKIVPVAWISNLTEDVREKVTKGEMDKQVVKVTCMEIDHSVNPPSLRHSKIVEYRKDKEWTDCGLEQLY